uniref:DDE Tnp4 domain-containing protein n=1 Tax=Ananas comosus var. bracteatus TaxID=296719 RepID=A0A6V7P4M7_ANACO|nr:unnamed protein product [Ananas comosus var. bracteatus]
MLRDAISRSNRLLRVLQDYYYLCDAGYPNGEGFLTPYRGRRYHLSEWRQNREPQTPQEFYNYKHSSARNVIERCFELLKGRWAIHRGKSYYPLKAACRIISASAVLHNHIRRKMPIDPYENELSEIDPTKEIQGDNITYIKTSDT